MILNKKSQCHILKQEKFNGNIQEVSLSPYDPANEKVIAFHASKKRIKILLGGNRSSKTESSIYDDLLLLQTPGTKIIIATVSTDMIGRVLWPKIQKYLPTAAIKKIAWINPARQIPGIITTTNDSQIHLLSYEMGREKFQGFGGFRRVHFDEESSHDIWIEALRGIIDSGGDAVLSMTPLKGLTWVYSQYYRKRGVEKNLDVWTMSLLENKHISQADKDFYISQLSQDEIKKRVYGEFVNLSGLVYKDFNPEVNTCEPFDIPYGWRKIRAIDLGYSNPFVCLWIAQSDDDTLYVYQEYYKKETLLVDHARAIFDRDLLGLGLHHPGAKSHDIIESTVCDHERQERAELESYGIASIPANKNVPVGIERVNRRFRVRGNGKPGLIIFNTCTHTLEEISTYKYKEPDEKRNIPEEPLKVNDHCMDPKRYGVMYFEPSDSGSVAGAGDRVILDQRYTEQGLDLHELFGV